MNIIKRNFFRSIRSEVFNTSELLEPMSLYKWQQLILLAERHRVTSYVVSSILNNELHPDFSFPDNIRDEWNGIRRKSISNLSKDTGFVYEKDKMRLNNFFLNYRLKKIVDNEYHSIDTNTDTLYLLALYISITSNILRNGIRLHELIELGEFLRNNGDKVDYVKFDQWINRLQRRRKRFIHWSNFT